VDYVCIHPVDISAFSGAFVVEKVYSICCDESAWLNLEATTEEFGGLQRSFQAGTQSSPWV